MKQSWDVVVVGGGPSGMIAAGRAAELGSRVLLLEKNSVLGKKLLITGGGRCNVTTAIADRHALTARYGDRGKYLHSLFARFSPEDTRALLRRYGLETRVEAEHRVFPTTDNAGDVRTALERYMADGGVRVRRDAAVVKLHDEAGPDGRRIAAVETRSGELVAGRQVILAVGGSSRPETGSEGDGFRWLLDLGLPVRQPEASLVPLKIPDPWVRSLQGLALPEAGLHVESLAGGPETGGALVAPAPRVDDRSAWGNARRRLSREGKLLFTHFGLSGPVVLNAAEAIRDLARHSPIRLLVDALPGRSSEDLDALFRRAAEREGKRSVGAFLSDLLPARLAKVVGEQAGVSQGRRLAELGKAPRRHLVSALRGIPCTYGGLMGQDKAVVSSGGLDPAVVDFRTLRVHGWENLAVLGDTLDFNRQSGGFSLQVCWASGWVAAEAAVV